MRIGEQNNARWQENETMNRNFLYGRSLSLYSGSEIPDEKKRVAAAEEYIDTFEDGDFTANPEWTENTYGTVSAAVSESAAKNGSYGLRFTCNGEADDGASWLSTPNAASASTISAWFRTSDTTNPMLYLYTGVNVEAALGMILLEADELRYNDGESLTAFATTPQANTWYKGEIIWAKAGNTVTYKLYNSTGVLLETAADKTAATADEDSTCTYVGVYDAGTETAWTVDVDDVKYV